MLCVEALSCLETVLRQIVRVLCVVLGPHDAVAATCPAQQGDISTPQVLYGWLGFNYRQTPHCRDRRVKETLFAGEKKL